MNWLLDPWPWYVSGPLIGLLVPLLLLLDNKTFGVSASLRHICAACVPANISFFNYDWRKESWNLFFVFSIVLGAFIGHFLLSENVSVVVDPRLAKELATYHITDYSELVPVQVFSWSNLVSVQGFLFMVVGGFLVGFGTRYAGGCTSGHSIMGLSNLQWPSLIATCCFMLGGFISANLIVPFLLAL
jgi:uncharacterized protein